MSIIENLLFDKLEALIAPVFPYHRETQVLLHGIKVSVVVQECVSMGNAEGRD